MPIGVTRCSHILRKEKDTASISLACQQHPNLKLHSDGRQEYGKTSLNDIFASIIARAGVLDCQAMLDVRLIGMGFSP